MPTYGVRQFIIVDPSGNYLRIGQPIPKTDSILFEENGKKPQKGTALTKAFELADRLANGKDDLKAAIDVIDKVLLSDDKSELDTIFKLVLLRMEIANRTDDIVKVKELVKQGNDLLKRINDKSLISADIESFNLIISELGG